MVNESKNLYTLLLPTIPGPRVERRHYQSHGRGGEDG
jgi:hypothetical protein